MAGAVGGAAMLSGSGAGAQAHADTGHGHGHGHGHGKRSPDPDTPVPQTPPLEKYVDPLPTPVTAVPDPSVYPGADYYELTMRPGKWRFHRDLRPAEVWGYWATNPNSPRKAIGMGYLGPTISVNKDHPTVVKYRNDLPTTHLFQSVVDAIRGGDPELTPTPPPPYTAEPPFPPNVNVWNVVHQHGGFTAPQSDGMPLHSFSPDGIHAEAYTTLDPSRVEPNEAICAYTNHERSSMLWYHDHGMGMTSLNVYAGLAGLWLVRDPADERLGLPQGEFEVPLILQDRTFNRNGSLAYTMTLREGEDTPVVNGKAYPFLEVEPRRYRLRILNASNERFWRLRFDAPRDVLAQPNMPFWLIGTDGGFRTPLQMLNFLIGPAERYDLIVDFGQMPMGSKIQLTNYHAPVHYPGMPGQGPEISEIMQFRVTKRLSGGPDRTTPPKRLKLPTASPIVAKPDTRRRQWVVYQHKLFSTMTFNAVPFMEPSEDFITAGSTEIWEYINPNHDAHPMHVHLVNFQVLNRQPIDAAAYQADYEKWIDGGRKPEDFPVLENYFTGPPIPPDPDEALSEKDTVKSYPETVTRIICREFSPPTETIASIPDSGTELPATYVHHCHLLEHEDDDLMRPWTIVAPGTEEGLGADGGGGHGHGSP
ncbi:multicopper oxidase domain-containing protein [Streptomyces sp. NBC_01565]|uniref:multicopper oxidase family protein n=1 Tax=Streptomyces sp. NBC_01565 TaxID=2975881 RepID=UPI002250A7F2|nr:multicopper oxidase domain-containing protein [Streptomyces sp. NBC_01565]MCX4539327.1 multicopper oxidase domain-containing protein [Streptomyces sp. NBC_01565]